jgi:hypothetical protein
MANFKKLSDVEVVAEPIDSANVLIEEDGIIKKAPKTAVGGAGVDNIRTHIIHLDSEVNAHEEDIRALVSKIRTGEPIILFRSSNKEFRNVEIFTVSSIIEGDDAISFVNTRAFMYNSEYWITVKTLILWDGSYYTEYETTVRGES